MIWEFRASSTHTVWAQVDADNYEEALDKYNNGEIIDSGKFDPTDVTTECFRACTDSEENDGWATTLDEVDDWEFYCEV